MLAEVGSKAAWAMAATKSYRFIRFEATYATKSYKLVGVGAVDPTKACKIIRFGARFGWDAAETLRLWEKILGTWNFAHVHEIWGSAGSRPPAFFWGVLPPRHFGSGLPHPKILALRGLGGGSSPTGGV